MPCEQVQDCRSCNHCDISVDMPDGIGREVKARAFKPEQEQSDNGDNKNYGICHKEIFTGPVVPDIDDELDDGEEHNDQGKQDYRRHQKQSEQVGNSCKNGQQRSLFPGGKIFEIDLCILL